MADNSAGLGCLGFLTFVAAVWVAGYATDSGWMRSEITVYSAQCVQKVVDNRCAQHQFTLRPTTYKLIHEQQVVVYWVEGFEVRKVTKCAIASRKNWTCRYDDESAEFGFNDGEYFDRDLVTPLPELKKIKEHKYYLPKWEYRLLSWQSK